MMNLSGLDITFLVSAAAILLVYSLPDRVLADTNSLPRKVSQAILILAMIGISISALLYNTIWKDDEKASYQTEVVEPCQKNGGHVISRESDNKEKKYECRVHQDRQ